MKLTVIIVNYNVAYFLEQCLISVKDAIKNMDAEVIVVDNNSVDESVEMIREKFSWVNLIANKENTGFSVANNQAMRIAKGEYVLLLNPDTLVEVDTFEKVVNFMDEHPDAGGLGVKMVDGKGIYLPESKRGLPTPWVSFCKIFGLSRLFPKSKKFNWYHLGHLDKDEIHEIEILSGAFMLMRKAALDKVGLLDEAFFMYGEDIDLSWRIIQGGYKNYYYPKTSIIHYKGESTKKGSLNYVFVFYRAMIIFAKKHFTSNNAKSFEFFINAAIYFRAFLSILKRFVQNITLPLIDLLLIVGGLIGVTEYYKQVKAKIYDTDLIYKAFFIYALLVVLSLILNGGYKKPFKKRRFFKGLALGFAVVVVTYALLPENLRFSRAIILLGTLSSTLLTFGLRLFLLKFSPKTLGINHEKENKVLIIGDSSEIERVKEMLEQINNDFAPPHELNLEKEDANKIQQLEEYLRVYKIDEVIFCAKNMSPGEIISLMSNINIPRINFKIAPSESLFIIGSNSVDKAGETATYDVNSISKPENKRTKRIFDVFSAAVLLLLSPILFLGVKNKGGFFKNIIQVLLGKKTWVGYSPTTNQEDLPQIKPGILHPLSYVHKNPLQEQMVHKYNLIYAKDYKVSNDMRLMLRNFGMLGGRNDEGR